MGIYEDILNELNLNNNEINTSAFPIETANSVDNSENLDKQASHPSSPIIQKIDDFLNTLEKQATLELPQHILDEEWFTPGFINFAKEAALNGYSDEDIIKFAMEQDLLSAINPYKVLETAELIAMNKEASNSLIGQMILKAAELLKGTRP